MVKELDGHVMQCVRDQNGNHEMDSMGKEFLKLGKWTQLNSRKGIFVCQHASATFHIWFICKWHRIHSSGLCRRKVVPVQICRVEVQRRKSKVEDEEEERTSRTSSSRSAGQLSNYGGSEGSSSITEEKPNH